MSKWFFAEGGRNGADNMPLAMWSSRDGYMVSGTTHRHDAFHLESSIAMWVETRARCWGERGNTNQKAHTTSQLIRLLYGGIA